MEGDEALLRIGLRRDAAPHPAHEGDGASGEAGAVHLRRELAVADELGEVEEAGGAGGAAIEVLHDDDRHLRVVAHELRHRLEFVPSVDGARNVEALADDLEIGGVCRSDRRRGDQGREHEKRGGERRERPVEHVIPPSTVKDPPRFASGSPRVHRATTGGCNTRPPPGVAAAAGRVLPTGNGRVRSRFRGPRRSPKLAARGRHDLAAAAPWHMSCEPRHAARLPRSGQHRPPAVMGRGARGRRRRGPPVSGGEDDMNRGKMLFAAPVLAATLTASPALALDEVTFGTNWLAQAEHGGYYQAVADRHLREGRPEGDDPPGRPAGGQPGAADRRQDRLLHGRQHARAVLGGGAGHPDRRRRRDLPEGSRRCSSPIPTRASRSSRDLAKLPTIFMGKDGFSSLLPVDEVGLPGLPRRAVQALHLQPGARYIADKQSGAAGLHHLRALRDREAGGLEAQGVSCSPTTASTPTRR